MGGPMNNTPPVGPAEVSRPHSSLAAATLIAIAWALDLWAWMPPRFLLGFFANPL